MSKFLILDVEGELIEIRPGLYAIELTADSIAKGPLHLSTVKAIAVGKWVNKNLKSSKRVRLSPKNLTISVEKRQR